MSRKLAWSPPLGTQWKAYADRIMLHCRWLLFVVLMRLCKRGTGATWQLPQSQNEFTSLCGIAALLRSLVVTVVVVVELMLNVLRCHLTY